MSRDKLFLQCPECGGRVYESDEQCMDCGADLAEHRREAEAEWAEADLIAEASKQARAGSAPARHWEEKAWLAAEKMVAKEPVDKARSSASYLAWGAGGCLVAGILGFVGSLEWENYVLSVSILLGGVFWFVILLAASRLLLCVADLTENVASMERRQRTGTIPERLREDGENDDPA